MLKIENVVIPSPEQWRATIMGARNAMNSWDRSDSEFTNHELEDWPHDKVMTFEKMGPNDHDLLMRLRNAGTDHRKFMRMITVYVDLTAPLYWWKEFDTYKVGTVANSCSTMHKIAAKEFTLEDFSCEHLLGLSDYERTYCLEDNFPEFEGKDGEWLFWTPIDILVHTIQGLNFYRQRYLETKDKKYWWQMIQLLPSSYNQRRTVQMNYEVLANIYKSRRNHKLDEWHTFCDWIEGLPYNELITGMTESERVARLGKELSEGFNEGFKSVKVPGVEEMREAFANVLGISKDELFSMPIEGLTPNTVRELAGMEPISHEVVSDSTPLFLKKSMTIPATAEDIEDSVDISHLIDITCSWDVEELGGERIYSIGPGFTREDLTPYELYLLERSEEYERRKKEE